MKKTENPFRILYDRVYDYFTASIARRVLFFACVVVFLIAVYMRFDDSKIAQCILYVFCTIALFASLVDTLQLKHAFVNQLLDLEADFIKRYVEQHGNLESMVDGAFSMAELSYMKKKKKEFNTTIALKFLFVIIFVVLFSTALYT